MVKGGVEKYEKDDHVFYNDHINICSFLTNKNN